MNFEVNDLDINEYEIIFKNNEKKLVLSIIIECCEEAYFANIPDNISISRLKELGIEINEDNFISIDNLTNTEIKYIINNINLIWDKTITCKEGETVDGTLIDNECLEYKLYEINLNNDKKSYIILKVISNGYYSSTLNTKIVNI